jgi:uncharacterized protein (DUF1697 family)
VRLRTTVQNDTAHQQAATVEGQAGVSVRHEDLQAGEDETSPLRPEVLPRSTTDAPCHQRPGQVQLARLVGDEKLGGTATARNWNVVRKLAALAADT